MRLPAVLYATPAAARQNTITAPASPSVVPSTVHTDGEVVHILQFLHDVDTCRDAHRPIPVAIIAHASGELTLVHISRLRVL